MEENQAKYVLCKVAFMTLLRMPNFFFKALFFLAFPIYKVLHTKRAYGRCKTHLRNAASYLTEKTSPRDVFDGIFWNAIDSYRGLARFSGTTSRMMFENEDVIRGALCRGPVAAISIHQGAFELLHRSLCRYSNNVHLVTDTLGNGCLRKLIQELRSDPHLTEYHPDESRSLVRNLFRTKEVPEDEDVSGNGILAMVFDQGKHTKGNQVKLFGQDSTLYLRLPQLVNQMGAGIVTFRTFTKKTSEIVIRFETYYPPRFDQQEKSDTTLVDCIAKEVELWISQHPSEWSWNYHGNFRV